MHVPTAGLHYSDRDQSLRTRVFRCPDPEGLDNLVLDPPTAKFSELEYHYDLTPKKGDERPKIRCVFCGYPNHWKGVVALHEDGTRILVGHECGTKHYGVTFTQAERHFDRQEVRQIQLRRMDGVVGSLPRLVGFLFSVLGHPVTQQVKRLRSEMEATMEPLSRQLRAVALHYSGVLSISERVRDYAAEARRPGTSEEPIFVTSMREVGRLNGWEIFGPPGEMLEQSLADDWQIARSWFRTVRDNPTSDQWPAARLRKLFEALEGLVERVERQLATLRTYSAAVDRRNLRLIAAWASESTDVPGTWSAIGSRLVWRQDGGASVTLDFPTPAEEIDATPFRRFVGALRMEDGKDERE